MERIDLIEDKILRPNKSSKLVKEFNDHSEIETQTKKKKRESFFFEWNQSIKFYSTNRIQILQNLIKTLLIDSIWENWNKNRIWKKWTDNTDQMKKSKQKQLIQSI